jgi:hypothetical protein
MLQFATHEIGRSGYSLNSLVSSSSKAVFLNLEDS